MLVQIIFIFIQSSRLWMVFARFFGLRRTKVCFLIHMDEVNFQHLSSVPIQCPAFQTGGFLHTVRFTSFHCLLVVVASIFQTHNFILSRGVYIPPYGILLSPHILNVSSVFPTDTSDMITLYKPIFGLGGGIRHMYMSYFRSQVHHITSSMMSSSHFKYDVKYIISYLLF